MHKFYISRPIVKVGNSDKTLETQSIDLDPAINHAEIVRGTLTVVGHEVGIKMMCLNSVSSSR